MKCKTVTLRKRKIKNGTQYSLCLDYYPGYRDNTTMRVITRESLGIYLFAKPANQQERDFNTRMMKKDTMFVDVQNNRSSGRVVPPLAAGRSPTDD